MMKGKVSANTAFIEMKRSQGIEWVLLGAVPYPFCIRRSKNVSRIYDNRVFIKPLEPIKEKE